jgi:hypothetical protein
MSLLVRTSTDNGALLVRDTDDPFALSVTESTSPLALRVRESTSPLAMRVRGLFSPASLPGLAAWYDASDAATVLTTVGPDVPATDGQTVRRWLDKSGAGRHLNQTDLVNQMRFVASGQNGRGMLDTNSAAGPFMETAAFTALAQPQTVYVLGSRGTNANTTLFGYLDVVFFNRFRFDPTAGHLITSGTNLPLPFAAAWENERGLYLGVFNGASSAYQMRLPALQAGVTGNAGTTQPTKFQIGGFAANFTRCEFLEVLVYQAAHTAAEMQRVAQYFANRWALSHVATAP